MSFRACWKTTGCLDAEFKNRCGEQEELCLPVTSRCVSPALSRESSSDRAGSSPSSICTSCGEHEVWQDAGACRAGLADWEPGRNCLREPVKAGLSSAAIREGEGGRVGAEADCLLRSLSQDAPEERTCKRQAVVREAWLLQPGQPGRIWGLTQGPTLKPSK